MTELEELQQIGIEARDLGIARKNMACYKSKARNYRLEVERCHRMLCRWLGEEDKGVGSDDGKQFDGNKWPTARDLAQLHDDMLRSTEAIKQGENMLREIGTIE